MLYSGGKRVNHLLGWDGHGTDILTNFELIKIVIKILLKVTIDDFFFTLVSPVMI